MTSRGIFGGCREGILLDLLVQLSSWLELHHVLSCDGDFLTSLWVAAFACLPVGDRERTKANEGYTLTTLEGV
jgi:hypothetical protein